MLAINEAKEIKLLLLADDGTPTTGTVTYVVYDEADISFATGTMSAVSGVTGLYTMTFTPDAAGEWTVKFNCASPSRDAVKTYQVGEGVETDIYDIIKVGGTGDLAAVKTETDKIPILLTESQSHPTLAEIEASVVLAKETTSVLIKTETDKIPAHITALATHDTDIKAEIDANETKIDTLITNLATHVTALGTHDADIKALLTTIQADLDNPNQYKADVSALALEATLGTHDTDIKAELGHATYGLSAIEGLVDEVESLLKNATYGLNALKTEIDANETKIDTLITNLATHATALATHDTEVKAEIDANETKIDTLITNLATHVTALGTHDTDIKAELGHATYGLSAIEGLVDEVESLLKNATYGLSALKTEIDANETKIDTLITNLATHATALGTHDTDIKAVLGTKTDTSDIDGTVTAKQRALFDNTHLLIGIVVADKTNLTANETALKTALDKKFHVIIIDDDDIDGGDADLTVFNLIIISTSVTDMTKINELTTLPVPIFTRNANAALTILRMGDDSGGAGTSWGETAAQTQINITNITHEITIDQTLGNLVVYSAGGDIQWVRKIDLVAGAVQLAEMFGDNAKNSMVVLPYDVNDEDGAPAPAIRVFIGLKDFTLFTALALALAGNAQDWMAHQGTREIEIGGLTKINTLINMLGRNKFRSVEDVFDYLVTGTTNAAPFEVITSSIHGSVLERLNAMMEKDTTPAFDSDTDSLEAISEAIADLITRTKGLNDIHDDLVTAQADLDNPNQYKADVSALALEVTLGTHDTDIKALLGHATYGLSALETLVDEVETLLKNATYGLSALKTEIDANETKIDTLITNLATHVTALGTHDTDIKALLTTVQADLDNPNQYKADVSALALEATLGTHDTDIKADIGDFSGQANLTSLLAALGIPDVAGKSLYTCLITDRLDNATYGLSALETLVDGIETQTDKLSGADADTETGALNLFTGERTIFEIVKTTRYKLVGAFIRMDGTTPVTGGATITVKFYLKVNGTYVKLAERTYVKGTDPDGITIADSLFGATGSIKVTAQSDNAGDTATTVPYQYVTEDME